MKKNELLERYSAGERNFINVYLREVNLKKAHLAQINLSSSYLSGANLEGINLEGADLRNIDLSGVNLSRANLQGANLQSANLRSADLSYTNLTQANLRNADLSEAYFKRADLKQANLAGANLLRTYFKEASINEQTVFPEGFDIKRAGTVFGTLPEVATPAPTTADSTPAPTATKPAVKLHTKSKDGGVIIRPLKPVEVKIDVTPAPEIASQPMALPISTNPTAEEPAATSPLIYRWITAIKDL